jgi:metal-sulfur cluster biosynthetic enzyme
MTTPAEVNNVLRQVIDPELGINIVDLGLVYDISVAADQVTITMTMTTPACPLSGYLTEMAEYTLWRSLPQIGSVDINLVWDPPWTPHMMSDQAKRQLGWSTAMEAASSSNQGTAESSGIPGT